jgi:hypothetical protein
MNRRVGTFVAAGALGFMVGVSPSRAVAAEPPPGTIAAWNEYTAAAEVRLAHEAPMDAEQRPEGGAIPVSGGLIHRWRGATLVRDVTVDQLLDVLMHPGTPPPQEDVLESRVLARSGDQLRVYLKLVRRTIISVTYDTEHDVTFVRHTPSLASSRSVATKIVETNGNDRGFLWRLNSYWQYTQTKEGVLVQLESLSLSRHVPALLRPIASPIVDRIARESMTRTLNALRQYVEGRTRQRIAAPRDAATAGRSPSR